MIGPAHRAVYVLAALCVAADVGLVLVLRRPGDRAEPPSPRTPAAETTARAPISPGRGGREDVDVLVLDEAGSGVPRAGLTLRSRATLGTGEWSGWSPRDTDEEGRARFKLRGKAEVSVRATRGAESAAVVAPLVRSGTVAVTVQFAPPDRVHGRVLDARGRSVRGAEVYLTADASSTYDSPVGVATTDANGDVAVPVTAGRRMHVEGHASGHGYAFVDLDGSEAVRQGFVLRLPETREVRGRLVDAAGVPLPWATVRVMGPDAIQRAVVRGPRADSDSQFVVDAVFEEFSLALSHADVGPVIVRVPASREPIDLGDIRLVAHESIAGHVVDASGAPATAHVQLIVGGVPVRSGPTDASGRFGFEDLGVGTYSIRADGRERATGVADGAARRRRWLVARGAAVLAGVAAGDDDVLLPLRPRTLVYLEACDEEGLDVWLLEAKVTATRADAAGPAQSCDLKTFRAWRRSRAELSLDDAGTFDVVVESPGYAPGMARGVEVVPGERREVRVVLRPE